MPIKWMRAILQGKLLSYLLGLSLLSCPTLFLPELTNLNCYCRPVKSSQFLSTIPPCPESDKEQYLVRYLAHLSCRAFDLALLALMGAVLIATLCVLQTIHNFKKTGKFFTR